MTWLLIPAVLVLGVLLWWLLTRGDEYAGHDPAAKPRGQR